MCSVLAPNRAGILGAPLTPWWCRNSSSRWCEKQVPTGKLYLPPFLPNIQLIQGKALLRAKLQPHKGPAQPAVTFTSPPPTPLPPGGPSRVSPYTPDPSLSTTVRFSQGYEGPMPSNHPPVRPSSKQKPAAAAAAAAAAGKQGQSSSTVRLVTYANANIWTADVQVEGVCVGGVGGGGWGVGWGGVGGGRRGGGGLLLVCLRPVCLHGHACGVFLG